MYLNHVEFQNSSFGKHIAACSWLANVAQGYNKQFVLKKKKKRYNKQV